MVENVWEITATVVNISWYIFQAICQPDAAKFFFQHFDFFSFPCRIFQLITKHLSWLHDRFSWLFDASQVKLLHASVQRLLQHTNKVVNSQWKEEHAGSFFSLRRKLKTYFSILKHEKWFSQLRDFFPRSEKNYRKVFLEHRKREKCCNLTWKMMLVFSLFGEKFVY